MFLNIKIAPYLPFYDFKNKGNEFYVINLEKSLNEYWNTKKC